MPVTFIFTEDNDFIDTENTGLDLITENSTSTPPPPPFCILNPAPGYTPILSAYNEPLEGTGS